MSEPKKLSAAFLAAIRNTGPTEEEAALLDHIDAITAEHEAAMTRAREDADRVGEARIAFEDQQQKRIEALRKTLQMIAGGEFFEEENASVALNALMRDEKANGPG